MNICIILWIIVALNIIPSILYKLFHINLIFNLMISFWIDLILALRKNFYDLKSYLNTWKNASFGSKYLKPSVIHFYLPTLMVGIFYFRWLG